MIIDPSKQTRQENYKLLIGSIVPRPIAFVTSVTEDGVVNAAPYSYFNIVGIEPPLIAFSAQRKPGGIMKDSARNILNTNEFIVHIVDRDNVDQVNVTSIDAPPDISEIKLAGLSTIPGDRVKVPRVKESKIAMECRLYQHVELGKMGDSPSADLIIGEVIRFHIADSIYENGKINLQKLDPISRLAGLYYGAVGEVFERERPVYKDSSKE